MAKKQKNNPKIVSTPEYQKQVRNRLGLVAACTILIILLFSFNFYHHEFQSWSDIGSNLNFFLLINLNVILLIIATLLILRNLIKLMYERRQRQLGFRLKFKLTLAFILVSTLPMLLFFFIANSFLKNSLDYLFQGELSAALNNSSILVKSISQQQNEELRHFAQVLAEDVNREIAPLSASQRNKRLDDWVGRQLKRYRLDGLVWYSPEGQVLFSWFSDEESESMWQPLSQADLSNLGKDMAPISLTSAQPNGQINRALLPLTFAGKNYLMEVPLVLKGDSFQDLVLLRKNLDEHKNLLFLENPIRANYTTYLLLFTLLLTFGGAWFGYYLARSIVEPIEILVEGTHRIAKGDMDFQIELQAEDEIGMLLYSFNAMTKELRLNRKKLAASQEELVETNRALENRNLFVELVLQNIQDGILSLDNTGYINSINAAMISLARIKAPKVLGKHYKTVLSKEIIALYERLAQDLAETGEDSAKTEMHLQLDKKAVHVALELFQLKNPSGEPQGRLLVMDDLSEIDRSTRARAWREVARRIAHEIKNPLTPIQLSAQRIRRKYLDQLEEGELLDVCTKTIIEEVTGLKNMVNEFSKFARIPEISPIPLNINDILEEVYRFYMGGLPQEIEIRLETDENVPNIMLDGEQMKRVFKNLIDNAIAALGGEGLIQLSTSYSPILKMVTVHVMDNGCGIPPEMAHRVFDPYVTSKKEGTGLGLAIVQQIISDHGGFIRLDNVEKRGTKFTIELPA